MCAQLQCLRGLLGAEGRPANTRASAHSLNCRVWVVSAAVSSWACVAHTQHAFFAVTSPHLATEEWGGREEGEGLRGCTERAQLYLGKVRLHLLRTPLRTGHLSLEGEGLRRGTERVAAVPSQLTRAHEARGGGDRGSHGGRVRSLSLCGPSAGTKTTLVCVYGRYGSLGPNSVAEGSGLGERKSNWDVCGERSTSTSSEGRGSSSLVP